MSRAAGAGKDKPISTSSLKKAFHGLEPSLGKTTVEELFSDLENYGITLSHSRMSYPLSEVEDALRKMLGEDAASLLVERLKKALS